MFDFRHCEAEVGAGGEVDGGARGRKNGDRGFAGGDEADPEGGGSGQRNCLDD